MTTLYKSNGLSIGGEWSEASGDDELVVDPATEEPIAGAPQASVAGPHLWGPFGGYKQSGIEFGDYGLLEYTQLKTVSWSAGRP